MKDALRMMDALADGNRLKILNMLRDRAMCVGDIAKRLKMSQPAVSHHLFVLKSVNLVHAERNGKQIIYRMNGNMMDDLLTYLTDKLGGGKHEKK
jgi:DNA-binding transcriptional ArsR family regulator